MTLTRSEELELALEAPIEVLEALMLLLPDYIVPICHRSILAPTVTSEAKEILRNALAKGHPIDRTNGDGPLDDWDGWLVIDTLDGPTYVATDKKKALVSLDQKKAPSLD